MTGAGRLVVVVGLLAGCRGGPSVEQLRQAAGGGDANPEASTQDAQAARDSAPLPGCGLVPAEGCCNRQRLWWCEDGVLKTLDCTSKPKCGWSTSGFYDCNTSGAPDPSGELSLNCAGLFPDGGIPDAGADSGPDPCGGIGLEGCCDGSMLKYCEEGELREVSCALNPSCGWFAMGQYYDCGTDGIEDPTGTYPRTCPNSTPTDGEPDLFPWPDLGPLDIGAEGGDGGGSDCDCTVGARPRAGKAWLLLLSVLAVAARRRR